MLIFFVFCLQFRFLAKGQIFATVLKKMIKMCFDSTLAIYLITTIFVIKKTVHYEIYDLQLVKDCIKPS